MTTELGRQPWLVYGLRKRSLEAAGPLFPALVALRLLATMATSRVAPEMFRGLAASPLAWLATAVSLADLPVSFVARRDRDLLAFLGSSAYLLGRLAATAASVYPIWLRSTLDPSWSLTAGNAAVAPRSLETALYWWPIGFVLAIGYFALLFRRHRGKAQAANAGGGY